MFIQKIMIKNYKCFYGTPQTIEFRVPNGTDGGSGLNILVGSNNSGKSTVFEAINFFRNKEIPRGKTIDDLRNKFAKKDREISVEVVFCGRVGLIVDQYAQANKQASIKDYIYEQKQLKCLRIRRSSNALGELHLWDKSKDKYSNESGIAAPLQKLFELDFIWADTNPNDEAKFGATTLCGKLLSELVKSFADSVEYKDFTKAFGKAFNSKDSGIRRELANIELRTQEIFASQFGNAEIKFYFDNLQPESIFKGTRIKINDGVETYLEEKGSGMQRCVALSLLEVYAEKLVKGTIEDIQKPYFLFIDEPETCLHPQGQLKLLSALKEISKNRQVFIATHSPFFIDTAIIQNVIKFERINNKVHKYYYLKDSQFANQVKEAENRSFFLRHRNIFFTNKALFIEGADDFESYAFFCEKNNYPELINCLFMMNGKGATFFFEKLCKMYGIKFAAIVDQDFGFNLSYWQNKDRKKVLIKLFAFCESKSISINQELINNEMNRENIITPKGGKWQVVEKVVDGIKIQKIRDKEIYVLSKGEVTDYLDKLGDATEPEKGEKTNELKKIFKSIKIHFET
jgi:predicted ATP-dependent endonuclease of OLD family